MRTITHICDYCSKSKDGELSGEWFSFSYGETSTFLFEGRKEIYFCSFDCVFSFIIEAETKRAFSAKRKGWELLLCGGNCFINDLVKEKKGKEPNA